MAVPNTKSLQKFVLFCLGYTQLVILWGAWVRISKSGAGCGEHWPFCHGKVIPWEATLATWIEFSHRLTSGLYGLLIIGLLIWIKKSLPKGHPATRVAWAVLFFTFTEALIGAKLVLFGLVADNASLWRAFVMALHQINSLLLTGSITLTWFWLLRGGSEGLMNPLAQKAQTSGARLRLRSELAFEQGDSLNPQTVCRSQRSRWFAVLAVMLIAVTGSLAALSNTLFPSESLLEGFAQDFTHEGPLLLKLRVLHPVLAIFIGAVLIYWAWQQSEKLHGLAQVYARRLMKILIGAILFGIGTLLFLSPLWMKLTHLLIAHILWIFLVLFLAQRKYQKPEASE